jgi:hypothetical protein
LRLPPLAITLVALRRFRNSFQTLTWEITTLAPTKHRAAFIPPSSRLAAYVTPILLYESARPARAATATESTVLAVRTRCRNLSGGFNAGTRAACSTSQPAKTTHRSASFHTPDRRPLLHSRLTTPDGTARIASIHHNNVTNRLQFFEETQDDA